MRKVTYKYLRVRIVTAMDRTMGGLGSISFLVLHLMLYCCGYAIMEMNVLKCDSAVNNAVNNATRSCQCHTNEANKAGNNRTKNFGTHCNFFEP